MTNCNDYKTGLYNINTTTQSSEEVIKGTIIVPKDKLPDDVKTECIIEGSRRENENEPEKIGSETKNGCTSQIDGIVNSFSIEADLFDKKTDIMQKYQLYNYYQDVKKTTSDIYETVCQVETTDNCCIKFDHSETEKVKGELRQEVGDIISEPTGEIIKETTNEFESAIFKCDYSFYDESGVSLSEEFVYVEKSINDFGTFNSYFNLQSDGSYKRTNKETDKNFLYAINLSNKLKDDYEISYWGIKNSDNTVDEINRVLPDTKIDLLGYSGNDIAVVCKQKFTPVTYKVSFYDENGSLLKIVSKTINDKNENDEIIASKTLPIQESEIPSIDNLEYWVLEKDKDKTEHTENQKYGTKNTQQIDLYKNNNAAFYPIVSKNVIIPMPLYVSAAGMNVVGYCCDQPSGGGILGYVTDGGYSFARYSTIGDNTGATSNVHPVIIVNPTKQYVTVRRDSNNILYIYTDGESHNIDSYDYFTKDEVGEYMSKSEHPLRIGSNDSGSVEIISGDVQVYQNDISGKYVIYQEYPRQIAATGENKQRTCWECVSTSSLSTGKCNWSDSSKSSKRFDMLHGPDNKLIGYIKWGGDFSVFWGNVKMTYLHWHNYYNNTSDTTASWYQPGSSTPNKVYSYTVGPDGTFSYTTANKLLEKDKWYAIIVPDPDSTNSVPQPLEITDENGEIRKEHKDAFQSASSPRSCTKKGNTYIFNITVGKDSNITWAYEGDDFNTYFSTKTNQEGEIIEVSVKNRGALIEAFGNACLYYPSSNVCVDCDVVLKSKKVYNANNPICIPEFSGCTFVVA